MGYTAGDAADPKLFERLVAALGPEQDSVGLRDLALDTLKRLTGRDDLGYDPDHPEGKGLSAWKELQKQGKLHYSATRGKTKSAEAPRADWQFLPIRLMDLAKPAGRSHDGRPS